jgi:hypothetical protein
MVFPWIPFLFEAKRKVSDIEFLSKKEFDGKLREDEGFLSATGDLATLTANSGKDMYLARAKCILFDNVGGSATAITEVVLKINGTVVETVKASPATHQDTVYEFRNIGQKVAATQIIKLEVISIDTRTDVEGFIECFEETTGESPVI